MEKELQEYEFLLSKFINENNLDNHIWFDIMEIIHIIELIKDNHHGNFCVYICGNSCTIQGTNLTKSLRNKKYGYVYYNEVVLESKIKSTCYAICEFVKWHDLNIN